MSSSVLTVEFMAVYATSTVEEPRPSESETALRALLSERMVVAIDQ